MGVLHGGSRYSTDSTWDVGVLGGTWAGTRINRGRRGTAISGIWSPRSRYRENDRDKWNPKNHLQKLYFGISSRVSLFQTSS